MYSGQNKPFLSLSQDESVRFCDTKGAFPPRLLQGVTNLNAKCSIFER